MTLFKINNIKIKVDITFVAMCLLWGYSGNFNVFFTMTFVIILHEFFHVFIARLFGLTTESIDLYPFGGAAEIKGIKDNYVFEAIVASAGPFISLITGFLWERGQGIGILKEWPHFIEFSYSVALINFLPVYPLDGGRVLNATLKGIFGAKKGRKITLISGIIISTIFLLKSIADIILFNQSNYIIMAIFMFFASIKAIKNPRSINFREKYWKNENVKIIKAYENERVRDLLQNINGHCFFCVLVVDKNENVLGIFSEKQLLDGLMINTEITLKHFCEVPSLLNQK